MLHKQIEYKTEKTFDAIDVGSNYLVVCQKDFYNGNLKEKKEYFIKKEEFDGISVGKTIKESRLYPLKKSEVEAIRTSWCDLSKINVIENPFHYIAENGMKDIVIVRFNNCTDRIYTLDGKNVPRAYYCNYSSTQLSNRDYDLDKVVKYLSNREDVELVKSRRGFIIQDIPDYNRDDDDDEYTQFVDFIWKPTQEDFDLLYSSKLKDFFSVDCAIMSLILKLDKFKINM